MNEECNQRRSYNGGKLRSGEIDEGRMVKIAACAIGRLKDIKDDDQGKTVMRRLAAT